MKSTPGPWTARPFLSHGEATGEWEVMGQRHEDFADRPGSGLYSLTECTTEADARLMAAAPDLLAAGEALKVAVCDAMLRPLREGDFVGGELGMRMKSDAIHARMAQILAAGAMMRDALAKARGES